MRRACCRRQRHSRLAAPCSSRRSRRTDGVCLDAIRPWRGRGVVQLRDFFRHDFNDRQFAETKKQILRRLWGVLENPTFERSTGKQPNSPPSCAMSRLTLCASVPERSKPLPACRSPHLTCCFAATAKYTRQAPLRRDRARPAARARQTHRPCHRRRPTTTGAHNCKIEELQPLENGDTDEKKGVFITT
jgi:hypothetical protein